jgi:hypothetical protein
MRCPSESREGAELLLAYSFRELDAEQAAGLDLHVRNCPACGAFLAAQAAVTGSLEQWEAPAVSPDFDRRLYRRIEQDVPWWNFLRGPVTLRRWLPMAAAAAVLLAVGLWVEQPGAAPPPATPAPATAQLDALPPEQAEHALQEMEIMQEFNRLVSQEVREGGRPHPAEPKM